MSTISGWTFVQLHFQKLGSGISGHSLDFLSKAEFTPVFMPPALSLIHVLPPAAAANPVVPSAGTCMATDEEQVVLLHSNCKCF